MMAGMDQAQEHAGDGGQVTAGERIAAAAGILCGLAITAVCIDLASGGRISDALSRRPAEAAGGAEKPQGGCPGGCGD
jgi:hypothetical protein